MKFPPRFSHAFTIVEMLAVVALIGVLAALLLPGYRTVVTRAKAAKCMANMKAIGAGVMAYTGENNGAFPRGGWSDAGAMPLDPPVTAGTLGWLSDIYPYVGERREVFVCPEGKELSPTGQQAWVAMPGKGWSDPRYPMHYAYNAQLNTYRQAFRTSNPPQHVDRVGAVRNLSGLPVLIDIVFQNNFYGGVSSVFATNPSPTDGTTFAARHGNTGNILWGDGRVTAVSREEWAAMPDERVNAPTWRRLRFCNGDY